MFRKERIMMKKTGNNAKMKKVPILNNDELIRLGEIMYSDSKDELQDKRFWKEVYNKRNLEYE